MWIVTSLAAAGENAISTALLILASAFSLERPLFESFPSGLT